MFESIWMNAIRLNTSSAPLPVEPYRASTSLAFTTRVKRWSSSP